MWKYQKMLQHPVKIKNPNPAMAKIIMSQLGGPDGEMGAATRYLSQRYAMPYDEAVAVLTDIGMSVAVKVFGAGAIIERYRIVPLGISSIEFLWKIYTKYRECYIMNCK